MTAAALGTTLALPTLSGTEELHIEPGTQTGTVRTLRGKGMPRLRSTGRVDGQGDLMVHVDVVVPPAGPGADRAAAQARRPARRGAARPGRAATATATACSPLRDCSRRASGSVTPPLFLVDALPGRRPARARRARGAARRHREAAAAGRGRAARRRARRARSGRGRRGRAGRRRADAHRPARRSPRRRRGCVLAQALVKGDRGELAVELATEAGVDAHACRGGRRGASRAGRPPAARRGSPAGGRTAREAAKQARRPWVPPVEEPVTTAALARGSRRSPRALVLHEAATTALAAVELPADGRRPARRRARGRDHRRRAGRAHRGGCAAPCGWGRRCCARRPPAPSPSARSGVLTGRWRTSPTTTDRAMLGLPIM